MSWAAVAGAGVGLVGGMMQSDSNKSAANASAQGQIRAAEIGADAARFRPVGITSRFGSSNFQTDGSGNVTGAGYSLSPEMLAQQNQLMGMTPQLLQQYQQGIGASAPMGQGAQTMMSLGNQYLASSPQEQAQKWMADQQALLAPGRAADLANLQTSQFNQGRTGLAVGGGNGMLATNPEMAAFYNAQRQQDLGLASQATQQGQQYAQFGSGMLGSGGNMLNNMYGTQSAAFNPYATALGGAQTLEGMGQQALDTGINIGAKGSAANATSAQLLGGGLANAARTQQTANQINPWASMLTQGGQALANYRPQQNYGDFNIDPNGGYMYKNPNSVGPMPY